MALAQRVDQSALIDKSAAASRIMMIGSSNFSTNFLHAGTRMSGVSAFRPNRRSLSGMAVAGSPVSRFVGRNWNTSVEVRMESSRLAARARLALGDDEAPTEALAMLDTLSRLPQSDPELRKTAWLAATALALQRCREPGYGGGPEALEVLARDIRETFPEGGAFVREFDRERRRCR